MFRAVGVGVDRQQHAGLDRGADMGVAQVEAEMVGVDLQGRVVLAGGLDEGAQVGAQAFAAVDHPPGGVPEDVNERVLDRGNEAPRGRLRVLAEGGVRRGDDDIQLGEEIVVVVEPAVGEDVHLRAGEDGDAAGRTVGLAHGLDVLAETLRREPVGLHAGPGVIGHRDGVEAAGSGLLGEPFDREPPVGGEGVGVQLGGDVGQLDQVGQNRVELAAILAELGRNPRQPQSLVDGLLGGRGHRLDAPLLGGLVLPGAVGKEAVLVEPQLSLDRPLPQEHIVLLGAGEVEQGRPEGPFVDDPQIDLNARPEPHRALGLARGEHSHDAVHAHQGAAQRRGVRPRGEDVDVADRLPAAPQ